MLKTLNRLRILFLTFSVALFSFAGLMSAQPVMAAAANDACAPSYTNGTNGWGLNMSCSNYATCSNGSCNIIRNLCPKDLNQDNVIGNDGGLLIVSSYCPGGGLPCRTGGATNPLVQQSCGSGQVDIQCTNGGGVIAYTQYNKGPCTTTTTPPTSQPTSQPTSNPTTAPTTPPVTPISCGKLQVLNDTGTAELTTKPMVGQNVRFRCLTADGRPAVKYFFTYRDNPNNALALIYSGDSSLTFPIVIQPYTMVQCNPCDNGACSSNESVGANCTFEFKSAASPTPTPTPGPQCLKVDIVDTTASTVVTQPAIGQSVQLMCGQVAGATGYIFQVVEPDGNVVSLKALNSSNRSAAYVVPSKDGHFTVECQICTGTGGTNCYPFTQTTTVARPTN